jgi:glycosyltransferase involved in cell wall biosynthesis
MGYKSNIGLRRLIDHIQLGFNLRKLLKFEQPPDLAFIGFPPIEVAFVMSKWLRKNNVPYVLDVKDMWPEIFLNHFKGKRRLIGSIIFGIHFHMRNQIFKKATGISSITPEFLNWALTISEREIHRFDSVNYLSTKEPMFTDEEMKKSLLWLEGRGIHESKFTRITFIGSITKSFDFSGIIEVAKKLNTQIVIAGDGPKLQDLKNISRDCPNIIFLGRISQVTAWVLASQTNFMLAPYASSEDFDLSIPNKIFDAMMYGKPILSSSKGAGSRFILDFEIGVIYSNENMIQDEKIKNLYHTLSDLEKKSDLVKIMGMNARKIFDSKFSGNIIYEKVAEKIEQMASELKKPLV